jgi:hypothetical protein
VGHEMRPAAAYAASSAASSASSVFPSAVAAAR